VRNWKNIVRRINVGINSVHILRQKETGLEKWLEEMKKSAPKSLVTAETAEKTEIKFMGM
jgi:hypothetical protein